MASASAIGYDTSPSTFSPEGRLFQVQYAKKASENINTAIGLKSSHGVVLASEKVMFSKLHEPISYKRIFAIDYHIGMAFTGWYPDGLKILEIAKHEAHNYYRSRCVDSTDLYTFHHPIWGDVEYSCQQDSNLRNTIMPIKLLQERMGMHVHFPSLYGSYRVYGCSFIIAGYDELGPQLYSIDTFGTSCGYHACAIGKKAHEARTALDEIGLDEIKSMSMLEMVKAAARIIYDVHGEIGNKKFELEMSWVGKDTNGQYRHVPRSICEEAEIYAKEMLEDDKSD